MITLVATISIMVFLMLEGPSILGLIGICKDDGFLLSTLIAWPTIFGIALVWQHIVLKVSFPSLSQALFHQGDVFKQWAARAMIALYLFGCLLMYLHYGNSLLSFLSISIILVSLYAVIVLNKVAFHMAKDERVWHPFR